MVIFLKSTVCVEVFGFVRVEGNDAGYLSFLASLPAGAFIGLACTAGSIPILSMNSTRGRRMAMSKTAM